MADHNDLGKLAEDLAVQFLQENGYKILVRNFRYQKAEIDIIAEKDHLIIVTEVKARSTDFFILPQEAVTKGKIKLIVNANHIGIQVVALANFLMVAYGKVIKVKLFIAFIINVATALKFGNYRILKNAF